VQWADAYPDARTYGCPGLPERIPSVNWSLELGPGAENPPEWLGEIEAAWLGYEQNPFNGKPFFNEVSRICTIALFAAVNWSG
jgi:hypothetical protein